MRTLRAHRLRVGGTIRIAKVGYVKLVACEGHRGQHLKVDNNGTVEYYSMNKVRSSLQGGK